MYQSLLSCNCIMLCNCIMIMVVTQLLCNLLCSNIMLCDYISQWQLFDNSCFAEGCWNGGKCFGCFGEGRPMSCILELCAKTIGSIFWWTNQWLGSRWADSCSQSKMHLVPVLSELPRQAILQSKVGGPSGHLANSTAADCYQHFAANKSTNEMKV